MTMPNKQICKAFAITSTLYSVLTDFQNGDIRLMALRRKCFLAMKVFGRMAGTQAYTEISSDIGKMWNKILTKYQTTIRHDEIPVYIEYLSMLIPPTDHKQFVNLDPYTTKTDIRLEKEIAVVNSVLMYDNMLNELLGTRAYTLTKPKPIKVKKTKEKKKSKAQIKHDQQIIRDRKRLDKKRDFLSGIRERAEQLKKEQKNK